METRLIITPSKEIRRQAREILTGKWLMGFAIIVATVIAAAIPSSLIVELCAPDPMEYDLYDNSWIGPFVAITLLSLVVGLVIGGIVEVGMYKSFLNAAREGRFSFADLKYGFGFAGKAIGIAIMIFIRVFLWSLLLIVPGIIAGFRYSQAIFILADDPSKGINQCIEESKQLMNGNKMKYFCLSLSFIGWMLLASIPDSIVEIIYQNNPDASGMLIVSYLAALPVLFVTVYMMAAFARFYQMLIGEKEAEIAECAEDAYVLGNPAIPVKGEEIKSEDIIETAENAVIEEVAEDIPEPVEEKKEGYVLDGEEVEELK